jgi:hypothetical protein
MREADCSFNQVPHDFRQIVDKLQHEGIKDRNLWLAQLPSAERQKTQG